jgi:hypothetical protein
MTEKLEEAVAVAQSDRDAAADYCKRLDWIQPAGESAILGGWRDTTFIVQAFARHRIATHNAAMDEAAALIRRRNPNEGGELDAQAITSLKRQD